MEITKDLQINSGLSSNKSSNPSLFSGKWAPIANFSQLKSFSLSQGQLAQIEKQPQSWLLTNQGQMGKLIELKSSRLINLPAHIQQAVLALLSSSDGKKLIASLGLNKLDQQANLNLYGIQISLKGIMNPQQLLFIQFKRANGQLFIQASQVVSSLSSNHNSQVALNHRDANFAMWQQLFSSSGHQQSSLLSKLIVNSGAGNVNQAGTFQRAVPLLNLQEISQIGINELAKVFFPNLSQLNSSPMTAMLWLWLNARLRHNPAMDNWFKQWLPSSDVDDNLGSQLLSWAKQVVKEQQHIALGHYQWVFSLPYTQDGEVQSLELKFTKEEHWSVSMRLYIGDKPILLKLDYWQEDERSSLLVNSDSHGLLKILERHNQSLSDNIQNQGINFSSRYEWLDKIPELTNDIKKQSI